MRIPQRRKIAPPCSNQFRLKSGRQHLLLFARISNDESVRVNDHAAPGVHVVRFGADAVYADDVSLVLDGSRSQQGQPMVLSLDRPKRQNREQIRAAAHPRSEKLWETEIVTNERRNREGTMATAAVIVPPMTNPTT